ncbi:MAG: hypothetical protein IJI83_03015 [Oscillospiraceae bacterium]|nr:hypothetical protein [Oscillospiraceae bacterium]
MIIGLRCPLPRNSGLYLHAGLRFAPAARFASMGGWPKDKANRVIEYRNRGATFQDRSDPSGSDELRLRRFSSTVYLSNGRDRLANMKQLIVF